MLPSNFATLDYSLANNAQLMIILLYFRSSAEIFLK